MKNDRQSRIAFFMAHAGYSTPPGRAVCAANLADAEVEAESLGWRVDWEDEDIDPDDMFDDPRVVEDIRNGRVDWLYAVVVFPSGDRGASLGGIAVRYWDPYMRVIEAELFSETLAELEQADVGPEGAN